MKQMEFSVNEVLYVTRANNYSLDIKSEKVALKDEIRKSIRENADFFINKNIEIIVASIPAKMDRYRFTAKRIVMLIIFILKIMELEFPRKM